MKKTYAEAAKAAEVRRAESDAAAHALTDSSLRALRVLRGEARESSSASRSSRLRVGIFVTHPIQYFAPLWRGLAAAPELDVRVQGLRIVHPSMYHLDLSYCPLDDERAMVCPAAFTPASARRLLDLVPDPLVLSEAEAMTFCANSIVIGRTILMPACPGRVRNRLEAWGFEVVIVGVEQFVKGGGAIRCLTNPLDVRLGRDLVTGTGSVVLR